MQENRTRHALGAWVRGTLLALAIVGAVALAAMGSKVVEWEHRWMVGRCPIAYVGEDGRIHLTNERGTLDVELEAVAIVDRRYSGIDPHPGWSPDGKLIAYTRSEDSRTYGFEQNVVVLDPVSGNTFRPRVATYA